MNVLFQTLLRQLYVFQDRYRISHIYKVTVPIIQVLVIHSASTFRLEFLKGTENMKLY
jgi:hypothetical protein